MNLKELIFGKGASSGGEGGVYRDSIQAWLPIKNIIGGVVITKDNRFVKILELLPVNVYLKSANDRQNIVSSFAAYLKIAPNDLQMVTRTLPADTQAYVEQMRRFAEQEENEDTMDFVSKASDSTDSYSAAPAADTTKRGNKVVNIHTTTQLQVVLVKPERFENASEIADHLREKRTVVLNLESTNKDIARRLLDFLSGVAYANEGKIKKVAISTYIITPYNVDILGDLIDELENNGLYF